jgi:2-dehydropantoate 2-reductase
VTVPLWRKRVFGAAVFPIAALTGLPAGELVRPDVFPAIAALAAEAVEEGRAVGADLDLEEELERIRAALIAGAPARASMLQDLEAGRRTEVDAVTGVMAELADGRGASAPVARAVVALVHGREHAWEQRNLADTTTRGRGGNTSS